MRQILTILLLLTSLCSAQATDRVYTLAKAIAKAEGFGVKNALPTRLRNPGDIRAIKGYRFPGQRGVTKGYVVFKSNEAGWKALQHQIEKIVNGDSRYNVNMTLKQLGKRYAESRVWPKVVAKALGVDPDTEIWECLDVPPVLDWR